MMSGPCEPVSVFGPCLLLQLVPVSATAPSCSAQRPAPRPAALYRSLRRRRGAPQSAAPPEPHTSEQGTLASPSSSSSAGSPNAAPDAADRTSDVNNDSQQKTSETILNTSSKSINGGDQVAPNQIDILNESGGNQQSQPDVVMQSTSFSPKNSANRPNEKGNVTEKSPLDIHNSKNVSQRNTETDCPASTSAEGNFLSIKKCSPARRSSFFHAINASLPPLSPTSAGVSPSTLSPSTDRSSGGERSVAAGSSTPTPTNGEKPGLCSSPTALDHALLFQRWVSTNAACCWNPELVDAVSSLRLAGALVGGWLVVEGPSRALATVLHSHTHSLLQPPPGYSIATLGEVSGCKVAPVQRVQFTPLGPALCWVLHCEGGQDVSLSSLRAALTTHFPLMALPDDNTTHAALTDLIRQRKVFHAGRGYSLVTLDTYGARCAAPLPVQHPPFRLLSTSEALTRAHGATEATPAGAVTHAAVQTDLADLLAQPRLQAPVPGVTCSSRRSSLRLGRRGAVAQQQPSVDTYHGRDLSDITIKNERGGSVLSKLLRVSSPRLASFSAQFPPPEWSRGNVPHAHSRATQTRHADTQATAEYVMAAGQPWTPRSSTLPRRPTRPLSAASLHCQHVGQGADGSSSQLLVLSKQESTSSSSSPTHRHRHHSPSPQRQPTGNTIYANPYRVMALQEQHDLAHSQHHSNNEVIYSNYNPYIVHNTSGESGLPPRPPTHSQDLTHRRTLSASPRRMAGGAQYSQQPGPPTHKLQQKHGSPHRQQHHERNRMHAASSSVLAQPREGNGNYDEGGLNNHGLSSSYNEVYDYKDRYNNENTIKHSTHNTRSAQNIEYIQVGNSQLRQRHDSSPRRRAHPSPHRTLHTPQQPPAKHKKESVVCDRTINDRRRIGNLSSSFDSGILPDQRSTHKDSSEEGSRSATASSEGFIGVKPSLSDREPNIHDKKEADSSYNKATMQPSLNDLPPSSRDNKDADNSYNRAALQLDLVSSHMNNAKKVLASPQRPEGLKNNKIFSDINNITKGSVTDLTTKNLGYTETNKCDKKMYVPHETNKSHSNKSNKLSIKHVTSPTKKRALKSKQESLKTSDMKKQSNEKGSNPSSKSAEKSVDKDNVVSPVKRVPCDGVSSKVSLSPVERFPYEAVSNKVSVSPIKQASCDARGKGALASDASAETTSVRTYPSLSELNFSSLAAQKILRGVSVNSIDTLLEVNLAATDGKKLQVAEPVTNTDFGYL